MKDKLTELTLWVQEAQNTLRHLPDLLKKPEPAPKKSNAGTVAAVIFAAVGVVFALTAVAALVLDKINERRCFIWEEDELDDDDLDEDELPEEEADEDEE